MERSGPDGDQDDPIGDRIIRNDLLYPSRRPKTYLGQLYSQPLLTTLTGFSQVANLVRNPYELINNVDELVKQVNGSNKRNSADEPTPVEEMGRSEIVEQEPIPVIPPIESSNKRGRAKALTVEEYENKYRQSATDIEIIERVLAGSMACNQLRAALWPYLFGLVLHRGRFEKISSAYRQVSQTEGVIADESSPAAAAGAANKEAYIFIEHEGNVSRWRELSDLFQAYQNQWRAITQDQETRFSIYRERKALIQRDVARCDRKHPFYADKPENLHTLTNLLMAYMMYDFDIGYVQGMSDIAGPILCLYNGDVIKAFWIFVEVMKLFRRNFELSQNTIHFQLGCLHKIIEATDPVFALYLRDNSSAHCFFAFKAILCQFKRELMNDSETDYSKVFFLWDTIWAVARQTKLQDEYNKLTCEPKELEQEHAEAESQLDSASEQLGMNTDPNQADSVRVRLTDTEIFIISLCLSMIRRERDIILARRLDGDSIHVHFIRPKLDIDSNGFIEHAINIYSYLKFDFDLAAIVQRVRATALAASWSAARASKQSTEHETPK